MQTVNKLKLRRGARKHRNTLKYHDISFPHTLFFF